MISFVRGPLAAVEEDSVVVEAGGVGLEIRVPLSVLEQLPSLGEEVKMYTYFQVREDSMSLYGFLSRQDREMFQQLLGVNGVGPKGALGILSALRPDDLRLAILSGDAKAISRAPGIGVKTAQRVILDLKDKVSADDILSSVAEDGESSGDISWQGSGGDAVKEAIQALVALGYTNAEAARAVRRTEVTDTMTAEEILKASLRYLSFL